MKVVRHVYDPEHIADEIGETSVANSRYSRSKSRRQKTSVDFNNQSIGQMESKSVIGDSMSKADDIVGSSPSVMESPNPSPNKSY